MVESPPLFQPRFANVVGTDGVISQPNISAVGWLKFVSVPGATRVGHPLEQVNTSLPLLEEAEIVKLEPTLQSLAPPVQPPCATVAPEVLFQQKLLEPSEHLPTLTWQVPPTHEFEASPVLLWQV